MRRVLAFLLVATTALGAWFFHARHRGKLFQTQVDVMELKQAIERYHSEYSKLPDTGSEDIVMDQPPGERLLAHLINDSSNGPGARNICFLPPSRQEGLLPASERITRGIPDAWGRPLRVIFDDDFDGLVRVPHQGTTKDVPIRCVAVFSKGRDGIEGTNDDVKSW